MKATGKVESISAGPMICYFMQRSSNSLIPSCSLICNIGLVSFFFRFQLHRCRIMVAIASCIHIFWDVHLSCIAMHCIYFTQHAQNGALFNLHCICVMSLLENGVCSASCTVQCSFANMHFSMILTFFYCFYCCCHADFVTLFCTHTRDIHSQLQALRTELTTGHMMAK